MGGKGIEADGTVGGGIGEVWRHGAGCGRGVSDGSGQGKSVGVEIERQISHNCALHENLFLLRIAIN